MKLENAWNVSKEKVLAMMGLQVKNPVRSWLGVSGLLSLGIVVGGGLALLLPPKTGSQVRERLLAGFRSAKRRASASLPLSH